MRALLLAGVAVLGLVRPAHASVTYDLTLTPFLGFSVGGTGSITLAFAPAASGLTDYSTAQYSNLSFTIGGQMFTAPPGNVAAVQFTNGSVSNITFNEETGSPPNRYDFQTTSVYAFYYNDLSSLSAGTIVSSLSAITPPPNSVPEPAALAVLGLGATVLVASRWRKAG